MPENKQKKPRTEDGEDDDEFDDANSSVSRDELDRLMADLKSSILKDVNESVSIAVSSNMERVIRSFDASNQKRFTGIETSVNELEAKMESCDLEQRKMRATLEAHEKALKDLQAQIVKDKEIVTQEIEAQDKLDRPADPALIRINVEDVTDKTSVRKAIADWLAPFDKDSYILNGPDVAPTANFSLRFKGTPGCAARSAQKAIQALRHPDGSWKRLVANRETCDAASVPLNLYISPDKSGRQVKLESSSRRLLKAFKEVSPSPGYHLNKREGTISHKWKPIAKVQIAEDGIPVILWHNANFNREFFNKDAIVARFRSVAGPVEEQWEA